MEFDHTPNARDRRRFLFPLGTVRTTPGAMTTAREHKMDFAELLRRHGGGDWGDAPATDARENRLSVTQGFRTLSSYGIGDARLWIITEADRSVTTVLRPDEY